MKVLELKHTKYTNKNQIKTLKIGDKVKIVESKYGEIFECINIFKGGTGSHESDMATICPVSDPSKVRNIRAQGLYIENSSTDLEKEFRTLIGSELLSIKDVHSGEEYELTFKCGKTLKMSGADYGELEVYVSPTEQGSK